TSTPPRAIAPVESAAASAPQLDTSGSPAHERPNDMDMTESIAPRSDRMNADDLLTGPRTFTIVDVRRSSDGDSPVDVILAEFPQGRPFKPSKSMRRILVAAWGADAAAYKGRRLTLFRDPNVTFGRDKVGGIRISHLSHIDKPLTIALTVTRGKRAPYKVDPLPDRAPAAQPVDEATVAALAELREEWKTADPERQKQIAAEVQALTGGNQDGR